MKYIFILLLITNFSTFVAFGVDKYKAKKDHWRIPEKTLLLMGLCFGSIGQLAGMRFFHHKTQKWYFRVCGVAFLILHIVIFYYIFTKRMV